MAVRRQRRKEGFQDNARCGRDYTDEHRKAFLQLPRRHSVCKFTIYLGIS